MKKWKFVVGIDVSKNTLDLCFHPVADEAECSYCQVTNDKKGYLKLINWIKKQGIQLSDGFLLLEHTGIYSLVLCLFFKEQNLNYSMIPGIVLKNSLGICRGKDDKKDAYSIARYGYLYRNDIELKPLKEDLLIQLQMLFSQRKRLVGALKMLLLPVKETKTLGLAGLAEQMEENQKETVWAIKREIKQIEKQMLELIQGDEELNRKYTLCNSVPGVGLQLTTYLLIATHGFNRFSNSRQIATFAGIAPFKYKSGISIKGKERVHPLGDKQLKTLLHMASLSAVKLDKQLKAYYDRKKAEGKNAMLVLNAVRNKVLARIMATINRGTPYIQLNQHLTI